MSTRIGAIHVDLGLNTAQFQKGVQGAKKEAAGLGASLKTSLGGIAKNFGAGLLAGVTAGGIAGIIASFSDVAEAVASIGDEAAKAGIAVETFQEWRVVAEKARIPMDSLVDGFKELAIRADEFAVTGKGSAAEAFQRLGLSRREVQEKLKDPAELLLLLIERTRNLGDTAAGVRIFDELFGGTGGERMVSLLGMSNDEIRNIISGAHDAGRVLDDELVKKAAELDKAFKAVSGTVSTYLQGAIIRAADDLYSFIELFRGWENARRSTVDERLADIGQKRLALEQQILETKHEQSGITDTARNLGFGSDTSAVYSGQAEEVAKLQQEMAKLAEEEERILAARKGIDDLPAKPSASTATTPSIVPDNGGGRSSSADAAEREAEAVRRLIAELEQELALVDASNTEKEIANTLRRAGVDAASAEGQRIAALVTAIEAETEARRKASEATRQQGQAVENLFAMGEDALLAMLDNSQKAEDAIKRLAVQLALAAAQAALLGTGPLAGLFGGGSLFGGPPILNSGGGFAGLIGYSAGAAAVPMMAATMSAPTMPKPQAIAAPSIPKLVSPASSARAGAPQPVQISVNVDGANGDEHVIRLVQQGVNAGLQQYDRNVAPLTVKRVVNDPRAVG